METGVYWRYPLTEEVHLRTVRCKRRKSNRRYIDILRLIAIVMMAYVIIVMRGDKPDMKGATVLMRGDHSSAV